MARLARVVKSENVPSLMKATFDTIVALTDKFCTEHLNEEYAQLARHAAAALCRKRPSPLDRGRTDIWACAIVYALGSVNFFFDKSREPHTSIATLCDGFGVNQNTVSAKAKTVRDILDMIQFDPNWCPPSKIGDNPIAWMITVNGLIVDARWMPLEVQEIAYEKGLIPYMPGEREH